MTPGTINIRALKEYASRLSPDSALRTVLAAERDEVPADEFFGKLELWLLLSGRSLED